MSDDMESNEELLPVVTSILQPISCVAVDWIIMEAQQLWSDLRYRFGTDDRRTNLSFKNPVLGCVLVAIPTTDEPAQPAPTNIDGLGVVTLDEYLHAVMEIVKANERIRHTIYESLNKQDF